MRETRAGPHDRTRSTIYSRGSAQLVTQAARYTASRLLRVWLNLLLALMLAVASVPSSTRGLDDGRDDGERCHATIGLQRLVAMPASASRLKDAKPRGVSCAETREVASAGLVLVAVQDAIAMPAALLERYGGPPLAARAPPRV
jgi:hypothetical protein